MWYNRDMIVGRIACVALLVAAFAAASSCAAERPSVWAVPLERAGVPNLHKVSDSLYRSAQPTAEGMTNLVALGVKTVINLRRFHDDKDEIGGLKLTPRHIPINTWDVDVAQAREFLETVSNTNAAPVLVHCLHGADRTGSMIAIYRVVKEGWTADEAVKELTEGGYNYHSVWKHLPDYVRKTAEKLKTEETAVGKSADEK